MTSTDLSLYEHEDQPVSTSFENEDIECLEDNEPTFDDDEFYDESICTDEEALMQSMNQWLMRPSFSVSMLLQMRWRSKGLQL